MEPLAGWTVAVTAERRADDQADMLRALGAQVLAVPVLRIHRHDEPALRATTVDIVAAPPDVVVATTAVGMRAWIASAWSWGLGRHLLDALGEAEVVARGSKASGALVSETIDVSWRAPSERMTEVRDHLLASGVRGRRIAVQAHGGDLSWFVDTLAAAGADVVVVSVYKWSLPSSTDAAARLLESAAGGDVDAITFTSPPAVANIVELGGERFVDGLCARDVVCACVGPITADAAREAGLPNIVAASPTRLGPMVRALAHALGERATVTELAGVPVRVQGGHLSVGSREVRLTPRERALLHALLTARGSVLSKAALADAAWDGDVEEHTVEVTVNRLRRKLGPAAAALETSNRRGYRLATLPRTELRSNLA